MQEGGRESALRREAVHLVQCLCCRPTPGESSAHIRGCTTSLKVYTLEKGVPSGMCRTPAWGSNGT